MAHEINESQSTIQDLLSPPREENTSRARAKHEQFLALLKSRYNYTNDKAVNELERLLKQFYRTNRSLNSTHLRSNFKHSTAE